MTGKTILFLMIPDYNMTPPPCCWRRKRWWRSFPQTLGPSSVALVSSVIRPQLFSDFMCFHDHWILQILWRGIEGVSFMGSSHGSHGPKDAISRGFRYMTKYTGGENGFTCLSRFPRNLWLILLKSIAVTVLVVSHSDRFFLGEMSTRTHLCHITT